MKDLLDKKRPPSPPAHIPARWRRHTRNAAEGTRAAKVRMDEQLERDECREWAGASSPNKLFCVNVLKSNIKSSLYQCTNIRLPAINANAKVFASTRSNGNCTRVITWNPFRSSSLSLSIHPFHALASIPAPLLQLYSKSKWSFFGGSGIRIARFVSPCQICTYCMIWIRRLRIYCTFRLFVCLPAGSFACVYHCKASNVIFVCCKEEIEIRISPLIFVLFEYKYSHSLYVVHR